MNVELVAAIARQKFGNWKAPGMGAANNLARNDEPILVLNMARLC